MDPTALLLTQSDVPDGFKLRDSRERALLVDERGGTANQAHRVYGKRRFLSYGDAIWSEVTVFEEGTSAHIGWAKLVDHHKARPSYEDIREMADSSGDESYVHTGTMRGKPGLWAAVRIGSAVHRFNTYGLGETESTELLRRQLSKQGASKTPST